MVLHLLRGVGVDFIGRATRKIDGRRRVRRLGLKDWEVQWRRPQRRSAFLSAEQWSQMPEFLTLRVVRGSLWRPGFRVRQVTLVTTLLDAQLYPAEQLLGGLRAALALCCCDPEKLTGRVTYSLHLLRELGREIRTLDGSAVYRK